jgi:hypothetical protein
LYFIYLIIKTIVSAKAFSPRQKAFTKVHKKFQGVQKSYEQKVTWLIVRADGVNGGCYAFCCEVFSVLIQ